MTVTTTQPVLQVSGIRKSFFGVEVLKGIDFDVRPGEVHGLVGERGRGVDGQSPVGDLDADVADPFDPLDVVATMLGANLGGRLIATMGPSGSAWAEWAWAHCSWSPRPLPSAGSSPPRPAPPRG